MLRTKISLRAKDEPALAGAHPFERLLRSLEDEREGDVNRAAGRRREPPPGRR